MSGLDCHGRGLATASTSRRWKEERSIWDARKSTKWLRRLKKNCILLLFYWWIQPCLFSGTNNRAVNWWSTHSIVRFVIVFPFVILGVFPVILQNWISGYTPRFQRPRSPVYLEKRFNWGVFRAHERQHNLWNVFIYIYWFNSILWTFETLAMYFNLKLLFANISLISVKDCIPISLYRTCALISCSFKELSL